MSTEQTSVLARFYEERYSSKRSGQMHRSRAFIRAEHLRIQAELLEPALKELCGAPVILDLGAGRSHYLAEDDRVVAVDISHLALSETKRTHRICAALDDLPIRDRAADLVICSQTLEHVPEVEGALAEIARVTRPGGVLCLTVPNRYALMSRRFHRLERKIDESGHIHEFREGWLRMALLRNGFTVREARGACYDVFWVMATAERSHFGRQFVSLIDDNVHPSVLAKLLLLEGRLRRHSLRGLSLEIVAERC